MARARACPQTRKIGRVIRNDKEVVEALRTLERRGGFREGRKMVLNEADYNQLSFEERRNLIYGGDMIVP